MWISPGKKRFINKNNLIVERCIVIFFFSLVICSVFYLHYFAVFKFNLIKKKQQQEEKIQTMKRLR